MWCGFVGCQQSLLCVVWVGKVLVVFDLVRNVMHDSSLVPVLVSTAVSDVLLTVLYLCLGLKSAPKDFEGKL